MATESKLTKSLYTDITRLKLLSKSDAEVKFLLLTSPFTGDEDDDDLADKKREEYSITGQIYPNSEIYRERSYAIEIILTKTFPLDPPKVRFITPIYHPNIEEKGDFCNDLLVKTARWTPKTSLVEIVKIVVKHVDEPDADNPVRAALGVEYKTNRPKFNQHALEHVQKHGLPR
ncbi:unnamed protein product [Adineta steineri]|uniref:UBC core domain-containing protein n=1 Tax=Adineta steineri TaxID=433720 RepID=A0A818IEQ9_9BILA|nr:unnamed protein product [Adineta steineri]CAF3518766.1 unnamed protein product [Adineta steineri]